MTTFIKMPPIEVKENKETKKTVFTKAVNFELDGSWEIQDAKFQPHDYINVMLLWQDIHYGDVFRCWDDGFEDDSTIFFGTAGDEFK